MPRPTAPLAAGLLLGALVDKVIGDPRPGHPVAAFGTAAKSLERRVYADSRARGTAYTALCVGATTALGVALDRATRNKPGLRTAAATACTWAVLGGTTLGKEARTIATPLVGGDLDAARARLPYLVGRDPSGLDDKGIARAVVESVAENTSDAVVAPLFWGAVAGIPGLLAYRAVNTLDAMVGYRNDRYLNFGWASAKLDDAANFVPARITGLLTVAAAPCVGGRGGETWRVLRRDRLAHPSPNAGHCEASAAGALGVRLGGRNVYGTRVEHRPELGDGPPPGARDIDRAARLSAVVGTAALGLAVVLTHYKSLRKGKRQ